MARFRTLIFLCLFIPSISSCSGNSSPADLDELPPDVQTVSLTGDTLYTQSTELPDAISSRIDSLIDQAESRHDLATMIIWQARKKAYQGYYREAAEMYSAGMERYPKDPRFYRHRGHRYITLRKFDLAVKDFEKAAELFEGMNDRIEPDGLPNDQSIPLSTLQTNTWYHLGLAYYLQGNFRKASQAYENGIRIVDNDDMLAAFLYWYYMALRRSGNDLQAGRMLEAVDTDMTIIENDAYHELLLVFKGIFEPGEIINEEATSLNSATSGYGLGNWHYINGRTDRAFEIWNNVYAGNSYSAFGYIASEAELARKQ